MLLMTPGIMSYMTSCVTYHMTSKCDVIYDVLGDVIFGIIRDVIPLPPLSLRERQISPSIYAEKAKLPRKYTSLAHSPNHHNIATGHKGVKNGKITQGNESQCFFSTWKSDSLPWKCLRLPCVKRQSLREKISKSARENPQVCVKIL